MNIMKEWSVRVEWAGPEPTAAQAAAIAEHLDLHAGAIGTEASGNCSALMTLEADTVRQAFDAGIRAVEAACERTGLDCAVMGVDLCTQEEFDRRQAEAPVPPLVGMTEIAEMLKVSRPRARELVTDNPAVFKEVARTKAAGALYLASAAQRFATRPRRAGRPRKTRG